ncbi:MAG TPA: MBL fold metallo-hydrolase [Ktedonobacteraceae bacterium]|nr:MBL fold metallo-hydrolase [Ktedonobacteraceae bacterium]
MTHDTRTFALGAAIVNIINVGDLRLTLSEIMNVPESEWRPGYSGVFDQPMSFPSQCIHIALPDASVLVDANNFALSAPPDSPYAPPTDYQPPPDLPTQLVECGIRPEDITHLVITHAHFDHYAGISWKRDGHYVPTFPRARCFLGKADWEYPETQEALRDPNSADSHTFGVVQQAGLLELVEGDRDITPAVQIIAAPGESPGHQIVRISSEGQVLYCLGDLYHHPLEVEHPSWMAEWDDVSTNLASRVALAKTALAEHALLIATHIPGTGRLGLTATGAIWVNVEPV